MANANNISQWSMPTVYHNGQCQQYIIMANATHAIMDIGKIFLPRIRASQEKVNLEHDQALRARVNNLVTSTILRSTLNHS